MSVSTNFASESTNLCKLLITYFVKVGQVFQMNQSCLDHTRGQVATPAVIIAANLRNTGSYLCPTQ